MKSKQRQIIQHPAAAETWKDRLRNFSMKIGFSLAVSKSMLEYLCAVADDVKWDKYLYHYGQALPENWIASENSLIKRGLIERKPQDVIDQWKYQDEDKHPFAERSCCQLTPAGECVVKLLKMAGLFVEADAAISKKARRAKA